MRKIANDPQTLVYFTSQPNQIIDGDPLYLHIQDQEQRERMIVEMARLFEAGVVHLPNGDAMIIVGL